MEVLPYSPDQFGGIIVEPETLPQDPEAFRKQLEHSLNTWTGEGYRLVWLDTPIDRAALIPVAVEAGFTFHHSGERNVMMTRRLVEGAFIPFHATHYIGAGGVVLNGRSELLVVCERHRRTKQPYYKLPGGALQPGEHLVDGVIREVLEETGVRTRFEGLVCFRHWHGYRYGKSDIYFVCRLSPMGEDLTMQTEELDECFWMPVEDYFASDLVSVFNKRIVHAAIDSPGVTTEWIEGYGDPARYEFFMPRATADEHA
ncbi:MAG: NUDIX domain-containing protein [Chloroflexi bacterium]|nr:NUDIX domain-containing protein [Chloroflexota bacterium]